MKNHAQSFIRLSLAAVFIMTLFGGSPAQTKKNGDSPRWDYKKHRAEVIAYARKYPVSELETNLPRIEFADWLQKIVGAKSELNWQLVECLRPNILPKEEAELKPPMCVYTSARITPETFLHIYIEYGTFEQGISDRKPIVRDILISDKLGNSFGSVEMLFDLPKFLQAIRESLPFFNPNHGEFEIFGKKPAGFEDFSSIWFRTVDYDSNDKPFKVENHGDLEAGGKHYELRNIFFDGQSWSFETEIVGGVSYKFSGEFAKHTSKGYGAGDADNKAIYGRLTKFVNGEKAAETDLFFSFYLTGDAG